MYLLYLIVWLLILLLLNILFRVIPRKIKRYNDQQTRNSLFSILMFTTIPLILIGFIAPILILGGDENMPGDYKIYFVIIAFIAILASFLIKKRKPVPE
jgi:L-asparagine transporter-like permease